MRLAAASRCRSVTLFSPPLSSAHACCTQLSRDDRLPSARSCFLRGSHVRFMVLPDILKNAPFFKKIETKQAKQAAAKSSSKAKQAAQQRAAGTRDARAITPRHCGARARSTFSQPRALWPVMRPTRLTIGFASAGGRRDVGMPEKQKERERKKNPSFN